MNRPDWIWSWRCCRSGFCPVWAEYI